jgi:hypothetical protein
VAGGRVKHARVALETARDDRSNVYGEALDPGTEPLRRFAVVGEGELVDLDSLRSRNTAAATARSRSAARSDASCIRARGQTSYVSQ